MQYRSLCLKRHLQRYQEITIVVVESSPEELKKALFEGQRRAKGRHDPTRGPARFQPRETKVMLQQKLEAWRRLAQYDNDTCIKLIGIPYRVPSSEIRAFFEKGIGTRPVEIIRHPADKGIAYCRFSTAEEREKALSMNRAYLGNRFVVIPPKVDFEAEYLLYERRGKGTFDAIIESLKEIHRESRTGNQQPETTAAPAGDHA